MKFPSGNTGSANVFHNAHDGILCDADMLFSLLSYLCVWVFHLHVCVCTACVPDTHKGQNTASDAHLELELQTIVSYRLGAGNQTYVLSKNSQCL